MKENKYAYCVCLATDNYLNNFKAFYYSFQKSNSSFPLIVIATDNLHKDTIDELKKLQVSFRIKPYKEFVKSAAHQKCTFNKLYAYSLFEYEKVMLLDADIILKNNLDNYFSYPADKITGWACLIAPSMKIYAQIINKNTLLKYSTDEQFMHDLFSIPIDFNRKNFWDIDNSLIHFMFFPKHTDYYDMPTLYKKIDEYQQSKDNKVFQEFYDWIKLQNTNNYAYVTLLSTKDYLKGVLVLNESLLEHGAKYPLIVLVPRNLLSQSLINQLTKNNIIVQFINLLNYTDEIQNEYKNHSVLNTASKIEIFSLKSWDKLVYIDADTLICDNVDELFNFPDGSMIKYDNDNQGFSGLFVFNPQNHDYELYKYLITNYFGFDGDILGGLWYPVKTVKDYQIPHIYLENAENYTEKTKIIHFINNPKPWIDNSILPKRLFDKYTKYLNKVEQKYNFDFL